MEYKIGTIEVVVGYAYIFKWFCMHRITNLKGYHVHGSLICPLVLFCFCFFFPDKTVLFCSFLKMQFSFSKWQ